MIMEDKPMMYSRSLSPRTAKIGGQRVVTS